MRRYLVIGLFLLLTLVPALVQGDAYWLRLLSRLFINGILALSIWPLFVVGRLNMGHAAFYGLGAYGVSILMLHFGVSFWVALPLTLIGVAILAAIIGYPSLRMRGIYFALATFALGEIVRLMYLRFEKVSGGAQGLFNIPGVSPIVIPGLPALTFVDFVTEYYLMLVALLLVALFFYRLVHSSLGLAMKSIHNAHNLAQALGINAFRYEMSVFVLCCTGAALGGALYAVYSHYLEPNLFGFAKSVDAQAYVIVGGAGYVLGPILGAFLVSLLPIVLNLTRDISPIITGVTLVLTMFLLRGGLITFPSQLVSIWRRLPTLMQPVKRREVVPIKPWQPETPEN